MVFILKWYFKEGSANKHTLKALGTALQWIHDVVGHPEPDSWLLAFEKMFHTRVPDTELTQKIEDMYRTCKECVTSKRNRPSNRGLLGVL